MNWNSLLEDLGIFKNKDNSINEDPQQPATGVHPIVQFSSPKSSAIDLLKGKTNVTTQNYIPPSQNNNEPSKNKQTQNAETSKQIDTTKSKALQEYNNVCNILCKAFDVFIDIGVEILDNNGGVEILDESYIIENVDLPQEYEKLSGYIDYVNKYVKREGDRIEQNEKKIIIVSEGSVSYVCGQVDLKVHGANKSIISMVNFGIWLKDNKQEYSTTMYKEKYLELMDVTKKLYVFSISLLNAYYTRKNLKNVSMNIIPATKYVYKDLLLNGANGSTDTKEPFISKKKFDTGND